MGWFKKKCDHDWHELKTGKEYIDYSSNGYVDGRTEETSNLYCPKCDTRKRVSAHEGELILKSVEIRKNYKLLNYKLK